MGIAIPTAAVHLLGRLNSAFMLQHWSMTAVVGCMWDSMQTCKWDPCRVELSHTMQHVCVLYLATKGSYTYISITVLPLHAPQT